MKKKKKNKYIYLIGDKKGLKKKGLKRLKFSALALAIFI